jgi:hypothetical protein
MSNTLATSTLITKEALAILANMLSFSKFVNRDFESEFGTNKGGSYASGQTINIKKPPRYTARAGKVAVPQGTVESTIPLTLGQAGVYVMFSSVDLTLNITDLRPKLNAAMSVVANKIDLDGLTMAAVSTPNVVALQGSPTPTQTQAIASILAVGQRLDEAAAPRDGQRALILGPQANASLLSGLQGFFNSQKVLGEQYEDGLVVDSLGFKIGMDQNVVSQINGTQAVTGATVNGANQTGNALTVAATTGVITAGSKFTIAGVYAINPQSRQSTNSLQSFTVTTQAASGATSLAISPAVTATGSFANTNSSPANGAAITFYGTASGGYQANVGFHRDAFTLACVPMFKPASGAGVVAVESQTYKGMSLRMIQFYDGTNDDFITRFDVLYGWAAPYPELACLLAS